MHVYVTIHGLFKETKTMDPYVIIRNNGWNITVNEDGLYQLPDIPIDYEYHIYVHENSNIDPGFRCFAVANSGNASLPFVNVLFICDWTSNKSFLFFVIFFVD